MSEFNSCASLVDQEALKEASSLYERLLSEGLDPYQTLLEMQNNLQEKLVSTYPNRVKAPRKLETKGDLYEFLRNQKMAFDDEFREMVDAIPGMSRPAKDRSGIWKKWKANHESLCAEKINDLSEADRLELLFECIDAVHFFANMQLALGLDAKDIFVLYCIKNIENIRRANTGY